MKEKKKGKLHRTAKAQTETEVYCNKKMCLRGKKSSTLNYISSVQFNRSVMSNYLRPHESQHARPPCLTQTPRVYSNSCLLSWSCHLILCRPLLLLPPIPPSIRVFSNESTLCMRWPSIGVSSSASVLPINTQD